LQGARRRLAALALPVIATLALPGLAFAADGAPRDLPAATWVLVDAADGDVLAAHGAQTERSIASTTKLMTAYASRRDLRLGETVVAPPYAAGSAESLMGLEAGEEIKVRDLLYGLLLVSGNDAAEALAQASAGSEDAFVREMNRDAGRLGLEHTSYANPIGLDEAGNYSSAADLAALAIELRKDALFREIFDTASATTTSGARPRDLVNRNVLVQTVPYVNGVKTGYTIDAGNVLVASGKQDGVQLVSAVLGAPTESERDAASLALLDYGFSLYHRRTPVREGDEIADVAIADRDVAVGLAPVEDVRITVRKGQSVEARVRAPGEVDGPVAEGERLGEVIVRVDGDAVGRVPVAATASASAASLVERYDAAVPGPRAVAWVVAIAALALLLVVVIAVWDRRGSLSRERP
jgi:serine-type D-Ala-D-Ala carboxypeptidase (penicillin-binding protein 5/6)